MYRALRVYELCFRAREGLPLPARPLMKLLIKSALARTQRDDKVVLCEVVGMANHPHMIFFSRDINDMTRFHEEFKKRLTDSVKRILGKAHLRLWEDRTTVAEILDLDAAIERIAYHYANPSSADLVECIEDYPGLSSWDAFRKARACVHSCAEEEIPWIRMSSIPRVSESLSLEEEGRLVNVLKRKNRHKERLKMYPFAWLRAFGVHEPCEIEQVRQRIIERLRQMEDESRRRRARAKKKILGKLRVIRGAFEKRHKPKRNERKIFFISSIRELRQQFFAEYRIFIEACCECYRKLLRGYTAVSWPLGAFPPPLKAIVNPI